jgi:hypothetical protein
MSPLAASQREFARALFDSTAPCAPGVAVYRSSVAANFAGALAATYPVVCRLVGEPFFVEAATRYAAVSPSTSGDLADYGAGLADFLEGYSYAAALAYLPDVARLEWACHECEREPEPAAFDFAALAAVAPGDYGGMRLQLHPAVRLIRSDHPIVAIHAANAPDRDGMTGPGEGPDHVLVRRVQSRAVVERIPGHEWRFLARLAQGDTLDAATGEIPPDIAGTFLPAALARHVAASVVCAFTAPACAR